jgi:uncharacterized membrane protein
MAIRFTLVLTFPGLVHCAILYGSSLLEWLAITALIVAALLDHLLKWNGRSWTLLLVLMLVAAGLVRIDEGRNLLVLPSLAIPASLSVIFGSSLRHSSTPLVTRYAALLHPEMPAELYCYTRGVTVAWTATCALILAINSILLILGSRAAWSAFANGYSYLILGAVFALEYAFRRWHFRHIPQPTLSEYARVLTQNSPSGINKLHQTPP